MILPTHDRAPTARGIAHLSFRAVGMLNCERTIIGIESNIQSNATCRLLSVTPMVLAFKHVTCPAFCPQTIRLWPAAGGLQRKLVQNREVIR